jgi:O-antigen ligase
VTGKERREKIDTPGGGGRRLLKAVRKLRAPWLGLGVLALGVLLGLSLNSSLQSLAVSIVAILVHVAAIVASPLNGLLLWVASNPFGELYVVIPLGESIPDISLARFCVAFLCTLLLAQTAIGKRDLAPFTTADGVCMLFMLGLGFSTLNGYTRWQSAIQLVFDLYYTPLLVYFLAKSLVTQRRDVDKVLRAVLFVGVYAGLYALYESGTGNILFYKGELPAFTAYKDSGLHVLRGLLGRSNHFGALFSMVIPIGFYLYLKARTRAKKGLYAVALGILSAGLYFTYKRTAWIAIVVIFFVIQWFYPRFRRLFFILLIVFLVLLGATWNTVGESTVVTGRIKTAESNVEGRTDGWNAALNLWAREPLFGYGVGNYGAVARQQRMDDTALESEHLRVLFGAGLLGFIPYVAWLVVILRDSIRLFRSRANGPVERELVVIFWGVLLGYTINYAATAANVFSVSIVFYLLVGTLIGSQTRFLEPERRRPVLITRYQE